MRKYFIVAFLVCVTGILFAEPAEKSIMHTYDDAVHLIMDKGQLKQAEKKLVTVVSTLESQKPINPHNLGSAYFYLWECDKTVERANKAKKYLLKALAAKKSYEYYNTKDPGTYCLLGELCLFLKEYKTSITHFKKYLEILKKLKLKANLTNVYLDMSIAYSKEKKFKNALIYIKKSLDEFHSHPIKI